MSARDAPAYADADPCSRECHCRDCRPDLDADDRQGASEWAARECGCLLCKERLLYHARD